ncbi:MAG: hypothetical protein JKY84_11685 [Emcibacteraceae bacterium]|nr:hypothetical protein [Emcibacteraceae bacterium]
MINWQSRLAIFAFACGASALAFKPIGDVLGSDALLSQFSACILLAIVSALPWLIITGVGRQRLITSIAACLIAILPPFGTLAAPNPYMAAGYLLPGTGILGLILVASIIILPFQLKGLSMKMFLCGLIATSLMSNIIYDEAPSPTGWVGLKTSFKDQNTNLTQERNKRTLALIAQITSELDNGNKVIIAPESVFGLRTLGLEPQLKLIEARARRNDAIVLIGIIEEISGTRENTLLILGAEPDQYNARQPVPFVMWNPWKGSGFNSHWFNSGIHNIAGKRTAILICWEEWVPWPMLLSSFQYPEVIVSASNHGWTMNGEYMWNKQTVSAKAISNLYGLPIVNAANIIDGI